MAGAGYRDWTAGEKPTANQFDTYLQEQTVMRFASSSARSTALTSVLAEGMVSYLDNENRVERYDGTNWKPVGPYTSVFTRSTNISVSSSGSGTVTFETEVDDIDGWWSSGTTFTCPADGTYALALRLKKASGSGRPTIQIETGTGTVISEAFPAADAATTAAVSGGKVVRLTSGDTFTITYAEQVGATCEIDEVVLTITKLGD